MRTLIRTSLAAAMVLSLATATALAGKPSNPPPPPPPPVQYALKTFRMPADYVPGRDLNAHQMTNSGIVVGNYALADGNGSSIHPFLYDPSRNADAAINLNDLGVAGLPAGWRIHRAFGVNNLGFVIGGLEDTNNPGLYRGYMLDLNTETLTTLPDEGLGSTYARRINDSMLILGVYGGQGYLYNPLVDPAVRPLGFDVNSYSVCMSNPTTGPAKVVSLMRGVITRYTDGGATETIPGTIKGGNYIHAWDVSPTGEFCGYYPNKGNSNGWYAFRYQNSYETFPSLPGATTIDGHGDFATDGDRRNSLFNQLYHQGTGAFRLDDAVTGSAADLAVWFNSYYIRPTDMTERGAINPDAPDFPGISGYVVMTNGTLDECRGFLLVPLAP